MAHTYIHVISQGGKRLIQRAEDEAFIPEDINNCDYQAYLTHIASGYVCKEVDYRIKAEDKEDKEDKEDEEDEEDEAEHKPDIEEDKDGE